MDIWLSVRPLDRERGEQTHKQQKAHQGSSDLPDSFGLFVTAQPSACTRSPGSRKKFARVARQSAHLTKRLART